MEETSQRIETLEIYEMSGRGGSGGRLVDGDKVSMDHSAAVTSKPSARYLIILQSDDVYDLYKFQLFLLAIVCVLIF